MGKKESKAAQELYEFSEGAAKLWTVGTLEDNLQANYEYLKNIRFHIMFPLKNKV